MTEGRPPSTLSEFIDAIRAELLCARCGRYVGSLGTKTYLPPPYAVAVDKIGPDDEVAALVAFEWRLVGRLREGNFVIRHPEADGLCVPMREWIADRHRKDEEEEEGDT